MFYLFVLSLFSDLGGMVVALKKKMSITGHYKLRNVKLETKHSSHSSQIRVHIVFFVCLFLLVSHGSSLPNNCTDVNTKRAAVAKYVTSPTPSILLSARRDVLSVSLDGPDLSGRRRTADESG